MPTTGHVVEVQVIRFTSSVSSSTVLLLGSMKIKKCLDLINQETMVFCRGDAWKALNRLPEEASSY